MGRGRVREVKVHRRGRLAAAAGAAEARRCRWVVVKYIYLLLVSLLSCSPPPQSLCGLPRNCLLPLQFASATVAGATLRTPCRDAAAWTKVSAGSFPLRFGSLRGGKPCEAGRTAPRWPANEIGPRRLRPPPGTPGKGGGAAGPQVALPGGRPPKSQEGAGGQESTPRRVKQLCLRNRPLRAAKRRGWQQTPCRPLVVRSPRPRTHASPTSLGAGSPRRPRLDGATGAATRGDPRIRLA